MSNHSYTSMFYHLVWSTKDREFYIKPEFKKSLYSYIGKVISDNGWHLLAIGGISDHIHILLQKNPKDSISETVCRIKANSSRFMRKNFITEFAWQGGYSAFTVDIKSLGRIKNYILNQEKHHSNMTFGDELARILIRYKVG